MFSGRWEDRLERDSEGRVFLDYNPYCFEKILDFLWALQVSQLVTFKYKNVNVIKNVSYFVVVEYRVSGTITRCEK